MYKSEDRGLEPGGGSCSGGFYGFLTALCGFGYLDWASIFPLYFEKKNVELGRHTIPFTSTIDPFYPELNAKGKRLWPLIIAALPSSTFFYFYVPSFLFLAWHTRPLHPLHSQPCTLHLSEIVNSMQNIFDNFRWRTCHAVWEGTGVTVWLRVCMFRGHNPSVRLS